MRFQRLNTYILRKIPIPIVVLSSGILYVKDNVITPKNTASLAESNKSLNPKFQPNRIRGNYENRIKYFSTPEKIFEYFASYRDPKTGEYYMTHEDFINSIIPYNFWQDKTTDSRNVSLEASNALKEILHNNYPSFFALVDVNQDNKISFDEYLFFSSIITTSLNDFKYAFYHLGTMTPSPISTLNNIEHDVSVSNIDFINIMTNMINTSPKGYKAVSLNKFDPRGVKNSLQVKQHCELVMQSPFGQWIMEASYFDPNLLEKMNSRMDIKKKISSPLLSLYDHRNKIENTNKEKNKNDSISFNMFSQFVICSHIEILLCELARFCDLKNKIEPKYIARLLTSWASVDKIEQYVNRVDMLEEKNAFEKIDPVDLNDIVNFHLVVLYDQRLLDAMQLVTTETNGITREGLTSVIQALSGQKGQFKSLVDILFLVFDTDNSGTLEENEFCSHLRRYMTKHNIEEGTIWDTIKNFFKF